MGKGQPTPRNPATTQNPALGVLLMAMAMSAIP